MVPMAVTIYGVCALTFMMAMYALERRGPGFVLLFALGCLRARVQPVDQQDQLVAVRADQREPPIDLGAPAPHERVAQLILDRVGVGCRERYRRRFARPPSTH